MVFKEMFRCQLPLFCCSSRNNAELELESTMSPATSPVTYVVFSMILWIMI